MASSSASEPLQASVESAFPIAAQRRVRFALRVLIGVVLVAYMVGIVVSGFDADELQSMIAAVGIARGGQLYVDIWDNHGPLLYYALAGLVKAAPVEHHAMMYPARLAMFILLFFTLWLVHRLARTVKTDLALFPELACLVFLLSGVVFNSGFEIRPDVPFMLLWAGVLVLFMKAARRERLGDWLLSGLVLGAGFLFSIKTLLLGVALGGMFMVLMVNRRRLFWREMAIFGAGTVVVPLLMAAGLYALGNLDAFWHSYYGQNADRGADSISEAFKRLFAWDPVETTLLTISLFWVAWSAWRRRIDEATGLMAVAAGLYYLEYLKVLPTHHRQSALPLMAPGAILIAWALDRLVRLPSFQRLGGALRLRSVGGVTVLLILAAIGQMYKHDWSSFRAVRAIRDGERRMEWIEPDATVVEGYGLPLFRSRPFVYKVFVNTICDRSRDGTLGFDFVAETDAGDVPYVFWDGRVHRLGKDFWRFLGANYVPLGYPAMLAAGRAVDRPTAGTTATLTVRIAGSYHWSVAGSQSGDLLIDGRPAPNPVRLADGNYAVDWTGPGPLVLCVAPFDKWNSVKNMRVWEEFATRGDYTKRGKQQRARTREIWPEANDEDEE